MTKRRRQWDEKHPGDGWSLADYATRPGPARWKVWHSSCDPNSEGDGYSIGIHRIQTPMDVVGWSAHLMEKTWLPDTDWKEVLFRSAVVHPPDDVHHSRIACGVETVNDV